LPARNLNSKARLSVLRPLPSTAPLRPAPHRRIGEILRDQRVISDPVLRAALAARARNAAPLGQVLAQEGHVSTEALSEALAEQAGLVLIDLDLHPPHPEFTSRHNPRDLLRLGALPWRQVAGRIVWIIADPQAASNVRATFETDDTPITLALAERGQIEAHIARLHRPRLIEMERTSCPEALSCRNSGNHKFSGRLADRSTQLDRAV